MTNFKEEDSNFYDWEYFLGLEFRYYSGAHRNKVRTLFSFIDDVRGKKVLDLGCGGGLFSSLLYKAGASVVGVDYSQSAIDFARSRYPEMDFRQGSAYDLSWFEDNSFDLVVMMDIIEHLGDQNKAIREVKRVLKPGGRIILSTDLDDTLWHNKIFDRFIWFSMRFSKEGRAYKLIKLTESKIPSKKHYQSSHIGLMTLNSLNSLITSCGFKVKRHEVYSLVSVWWRDWFFSLLPQKARGEHQMIMAIKP